MLHERAKLFHQQLYLLSIKIKIILKYLLIIIDTQIIYNIFMCGSLFVGVFTSLVDSYMQDDSPILKRIMKIHWIHQSHFFVVWKMKNKRYSVWQYKVRKTPIGKIKLGNILLGNIPLGNIPLDNIPMFCIIVYLTKSYLSQLKQLCLELTHSVEIAKIAYTSSLLEWGSKSASSQNKKYFL